MLSLLENGRREPKLSLIESLADALGVPADELMRREAPSRRAQLEIALAEAQRDPVYAALGLPYLRPGPRVPSDVIEHVLALFERAAQAAGQADRHARGGPGGQRRTCGR